MASLTTAKLGRRSVSQRLLWETRRNRWPYLFMLPSVVILGVFLIYPALWAFVISFFNFDYFGNEHQFVGLRNYRQTLSDPLFWLSLWNMTVFTLVFIPGTLVISMILALLLNQKLRGRAFFRMMLYLPFVISIVASALLFQWIYFPNGLLQNVVDLFGIQLPNGGVLADTRTAMPAIGVMSIWRNAGYFMVLLLAGLQGIPDDLYEASSIDGANRWQDFRHITLPMLRPVLAVVILLLIIYALRVFQEPFVMTGGGPANSTQTLSLMIYNRGFLLYEFGPAAAVSYLLFVIAAVFAFLQNRFFSDNDGA